ncbi:hypothetical protein THAR02_11476 [Trichoderma harzianum]|uniref:Reverse transcriptase n=1 Tax=Trichoderma harzianum TaxID=5544 RepID=A0A0F9ZTJ9_TRIHA|nr:hypothetical protein THAR02_11476 [Trichoderma harzianum]
MHSFAWTLPSVDLTSPSETNLNKCAKALQDLFKQVIEAAGRTRHQNGYSVPWWSEKCKAAYKAYREATDGSPAQEEARKTLRDIIRRSKRSHWDEIIAEASATRNIWSVAKWRKAIDRFQPPPLIDGDKSILDPTERATFLRDKLLKRKTTEEDIPDLWEEDLPVNKNIYWDQTVSEPEAKKATTGSGNTAPGADGILVALL